MWPIYRTDGSISSNASKCTDIERKEFGCLVASIGSVRVSSTQPVVAEVNARASVDAVPPTGSQNFKAALQTAGEGQPKRLNPGGGDNKDERKGHSEKKERDESVSSPADAGPDLAIRVASPVADPSTRQSWTDPADKTLPSDQDTSVMDVSATLAGPMDVSGAICSQIRVTGTQAVEASDLPHPSSGPVGESAEDSKTPETSGQSRANTFANAVPVSPATAVVPSVTRSIAAGLDLGIKALVLETNAGTTTTTSKRVAESTVARSESSLTVSSKQADSAQLTPHAQLIAVPVVSNTISPSLLPVEGGKFETFSGKSAGSTPIDKPSAVDARSKQKGDDAIQTVNSKGESTSPEQRVTGISQAESSTSHSSANQPDQQASSSLSNGVTPIPAEVSAMVSSADKSGSDKGSPAPEGAPASTNVDAGAMPGVSSAHLVQSLHQSEMRLGMNSSEFGAISISTSVSRQTVSAQISVDHSELSRALSLHLPAVEERLGHAYGLQAKVEVRDGSSSSYGSSQQRAREEAKQRGSFAPVAAPVIQSNIRSTSIAGAVTALSEMRLDVRV